MLQEQMDKLKDAAAKLDEASEKLKNMHQQHQAVGFVPTAIDMGQIMNIIKIVIDILMKVIPLIMGAIGK